MSGAAERAAASYRRQAEVDAEPMTEDEALGELLRRSAALRRKLLKRVIASGLLGGFGLLYLYGTLATQIYGRVAGAFFCVGAIVTFAAARRVADLVARRAESRWIDELSARHGLDVKALRGVMGMLG